MSSRPDAFFSTPLRTEASFLTGQSVPPDVAAVKISHSKKRAFNAIFWVLGAKNHQKLLEIESIFVIPIIAS